MATTAIPSIANPSGIDLEAAEASRTIAKFAEKHAGYFERTFDKIQRAKLPLWHLNWVALIAGPLWPAARGMWLFFWIALALDVIGLACLVQIFKYSPYLADAIAQGSAFLETRYTDWLARYTNMGIAVLILGRLGTAWLADRLYYRHYGKWRVDTSNPSGWKIKRILTAGLLILMLVPLTLYRASEERKDDRECLKLERSLAKGNQHSFKEKFDCFAIDDFPNLFSLDPLPDRQWIKKRTTGEVVIKTKPPIEGRRVDLKTFVADAIDQGISRTKAYYAGIIDGTVRNLKSFMNTVQLGFVSVPWAVVMFIILAIGAAYAGVRVAIFVALAMAGLALFGLWAVAMETVALVLVATLICVVVGIPVGIWMTKSKIVSNIVTPILDFMQTIPSFALLVPAVAFLSSGKPAAIIATVIFAMPPMVKLTALGIQGVPDSTKEAALAFGANPRQLLAKVELPMATPSIMAGLNQCIMLALSMATIASLIGAGGLGFLVTDALGQTQAGKGLIAGIGIALIAIMIDRIIQGIRAKSDISVRS